MKKFLTVLLLLSFALIMSCDKDKDDGNEEETPTVPQPVTITQANGLAFDGKVTIKTGDPYTVADWNAVVANVITAFNAAYAGASDTFDYDLVAKEGDGIQIVLQNDLAKNWEVKSGTKYGTLYIKTSSILTIAPTSYESAMVSVAMNHPSASITKATPPKDRVFLVYMFSHSGNLDLLHRSRDEKRG